MVYFALDTPESDRVRKDEAAAAARLIAQQLGGDLLLVVTNSPAGRSCAASWWLDDLAHDGEAWAEFLCEALATLTLSSR